MTGIQGSASEGANGTLLVSVSEPEVSAVPLGTAARIDEARPRLVNDEAEVCDSLPCGVGDKVGIRERGLEEVAGLRSEKWLHAVTDRGAMVTAAPQRIAQRS